MLKHSRLYLSIVALLSLAALCVAMISQHYFGMQPCAWCVLQRLILVVICVLAILGSFFGFALRKFFALITAVLSICGIVAAWYQYTVASHMFSCDMTFADKFMSQTTRLDSMAPWLFGIYASCMDAKVSVLGIDYAIWGMILFVICCALSLLVLFGKRPAQA